MSDCTTSQVVLKRENLHGPEGETLLAPQTADETPIVFPPTPPATPKSDTPKKKVSFSGEVTGLHHNGLCHVSAKVSRVRRHTRCR